MSGVFGVALSQSSDNQQYDSEAEALIHRMADALSHCEWHVTDQMVDRDCQVALGRVGIGIFNAQPQPVWNENKTIALVMAGELYNQHELGTNGASAGLSDEQLALRLYEQYGDNFASRLNGVFIIAIWDKARQRILITNDRFALYPLFYACQAGRFLFGPEVKAILGDAAFRRTLDTTALAQYLRFQHLLGDRTFFEDIKLLANASILSFDTSTGQYNITPYWSFDDIPHQPNVTFKDAVAEAGRLFKKSVQRLSGDSYRPGVFLSGGLDSRAILGATTRRPIASVTYGQENCRDVYYAQLVANAVKSDHYWFDLPNGNWVKELADFHLTLTEGYHSWIHAHGLSTLSHVRQLMDVNLTGWDGGTVMGHNDSIEPLQTHAVDAAALTVRAFNLFNQKYTWPSITESEEGLLYHKNLSSQLRGLAFDSLQKEMNCFLHYRPDVRSEYFYIRNHCMRLTHNLVTFTRSHVEVRFPFFDYDLFDFLYGIPAYVRGHRDLYRALIQKEMPRLAYIPYEHDDRLPTTNPLIRLPHALKVRITEFVNHHFRPIFPKPATLYADYENYLRHELRPWAKDILFDPRTMDRGIFDPPFVQSLFDRHMSGIEEWTIGKIAPIMTYELMLRRFYDE